jgi:acyl dehydratase
MVPAAEIGPDRTATERRQFGDNSATGQDRTGHDAMVYGWFEDMTAGDADTIGEYVVDEAEMIAFAEKWDPFPFHVDREQAAKSIHGGLIASGEYTMAIKQILLHRNGIPPGVMASLGYDELRYLKPVRAGDRISVRLDVLEKRDSRSKPDRGIVRVRTTLKNQDNTDLLTYIDNVLIAKKTSEENS